MDIGWRRERKAKMRNKPTSKFQVYFNILYFGFGKHKRARVFSYKPGAVIYCVIETWKKFSDSLTQVDRGIDEKSQNWDQTYLLVEFSLFNK